MRPSRINWDALETRQWASKWEAEGFRVIRIETPKDAYAQIIAEAEAAIAKALLPRIGFP